METTSYSYYLIWPTRKPGVKHKAQVEKILVDDFDSDGKAFSYAMKKCLLLREQYITTLSLHKVIKKTHWRIRDWVI